MQDINLLKDNGVSVDEAIELLGDVEMYNEILNDFLEATEERMSKIEEYKNTQDMKNYAIEVHALKSDSKYLGFTKLSDMALDHQLKSEEEDIAYINSHYVELVEEVNNKILLAKKYLG